MRNNYNQLYFVLPCHIFAENNYFLQDLISYIVLSKCVWLAWIHVELMWKPRKLEGGVGSLFLPMCNGIAVVAILMFMYGGWFIVPLDCFGTNSANYCCCAFTKQCNKRIRNINSCRNDNRGFSCDVISSQFCKSSYSRPPCWFPLYMEVYWKIQQNLLLLFIKFIPQYQTTSEWQEY